MTESTGTPGRNQLILIAGSIVLAVVLFWGFDTVPSRHRLVEKSRATGMAGMQEAQSLIREARDALPADERRFIRGQEHIAEGAPNDSMRIEALKTLSGTWFDLGYYVLAGYYAEQVALAETTEESWSIAGSTYAIALTREEEHLRRIAFSGAVRAYENAISLNPDGIDNRINLAICYVEYAPADNPMRGIQDLLALHREHPENTSVLYHLARFGVRSGQYDRARDRLEQAFAINPGERRLHCLMAEVLDHLGDVEAAHVHHEICAAGERTQQRG